MKPLNLNALLAAHPDTDPGELQRLAAELRKVLKHCPKNGGSTTARFPAYCREVSLRVSSWYLLADLFDRLAEAAPVNATSAEAEAVKP